MRLEDLSDKDLVKLHRESKTNIVTQAESIGFQLMVEEMNRRKIYPCLICGGLATRRLHTGQDRGFFHLCGEHSCEKELDSRLRFTGK